MILSLLRRYSLKLTFALTLLIGLQLPHFLTQYEIRVDAHYLESQAQLKHYQQLADLLFSGDLNALVEKHKNSDIALFKAETTIISTLISRSAFLKKQKMALQGSFYQRFSFLMSQINQPIFIETKNNYKANIVLNQQAIVVGLSLAVVITLLLDILFILLALFFKKRVIGW
ncbi:MAG: DUF2937 family protein [Psychromonas sp.]